MERREKYVGIAALGCPPGAARLDAARIVWSFRRSSGSRLRRNLRRTAQRDQRGLRVMVSAGDVRIF